MEQQDVTGKNKWYARLAWLFLFLFALLWSLGAFFFWVLLGFAGIFSFLSLYHSGIKISLFDNPKQGNPYKSYAENRGSTVAQGQGGVKLIRIAVIIAGALFILSIGYGIFSSSDETVSSNQLPVEQETEALTSSTEEPMSYGAKGIALFNDEQYDSALYYYDKALAENPGDNDALYNKALAYFMKKEFRTSIGIVKRYNQQNSDNNQGLWLLGDNYYELNQYDSALSSLERAYNNNFEEPDFLELLGDTYQMTNSADKAKAMYLKVIQKDSTNTEVYLELIKVDPENAATYRKKANSINKDSN